MPTSVKDRPKTAQTLFDEQMAEEKKRAADWLENTDFQAGYRAAERGDDHTATGRIIRHQGRIRRRSTGGHNHLQDLKRAWAMGGLFDVTKILVEDIIGLARTATHALAAPAAGDNGGISSKFGNTVKSNRQLQPHHDDGEYIYDAIYTSQAVHAKLMKESDAIAAKVEKLETLFEPAARAQAKKVIEKMAEDFEMRLHPVTQVYIHDFNRVMREEQACGHNKGLRNDFRVCVYLHKSQHEELKGIKAKIGDPYNEDPREAIAAGDHLKGANPAPAPAAPAPAPNLS